jgi:hypothetical protein
MGYPMAAQNWGSFRESVSSWEAVTDVLVFGNTYAYARHSFACETAQLFENLLTVAYPVTRNGLTDRPINDNLSA